MQPQMRQQQGAAGAPRPPGYIGQSPGGGGGGFFGWSR
jgi:hypothetical protein